MPTFPHRPSDPTPPFAPAPRRPEPDSPARAGRRRALCDAMLAPADPVDPGAAAARADAVAARFAPEGAWRGWLAAQVAGLMGQIDHLAAVERRLRAWTAYRAIDFWDDDQRLAAEALGATLARAPGRVVARLRASVAGCDWLLARWRHLARVGGPGWADEQHLLAAHLLGAAAPVGPLAPHQVDAQIRDLEAAREQARAADELLRGLVEAGLADGPAPDLARLRRHERALQARLRWFVAQLDAAPVVPPPAPGDGTNPTAPAPADDETNPTRPDRSPRGTQVDPARPGVAPPSARGASRAADRGRRIDPARAAARARHASRFPS